MHKRKALFCVYKVRPNSVFKCLQKSYQHRYRSNIERDRVLKVEIKWHGHSKTKKDKQTGNDNHAKVITKNATRTLQQQENFRALKW